MPDKEAIQKYIKAGTQAQKARIIADAAFAWGMFADEVQEYLEREASRR